MNSLAADVVQCNYDRHAPAILALFNDAICNSTSVYAYRPRSLDFMKSWFDAKAKDAFPVIGIEDDAGELMGFATYGHFRAWPAYKYSVEHSVHVAPRFRRQGIGKRLMREIIRAAEAQQYHVLIGGIDATNEVSIALHESLGFSHCGTVRQVGYKFGRWLDLDFYQLILPTPAEPNDEQIHE